MVVFTISCNKLLLYRFQKAYDEVHGEGEFYSSIVRIKVRLNSMTFVRVALLSGECRMTQIRHLLQDTFCFFWLERRYDIVDIIFNILRRIINLPRT